MTVKDLIIKEGCLCVSYPIDNKHHLFIEGLDTNGEVINSKFFTYSTQLKNVLVEIINDNGYTCEVIDTIEASLSTKLTDLVKEANIIINK